jgi:hypothetical protein
LNVKDERSNRDPSSAIHAFTVVGWSKHVGIDAAKWPNLAA